MSLFVSNETVKLYVKDGKLTEEEVSEWIEVLKEPPAGVVEKAMRAIRPKELLVSRDGSARIKLEDVQEIPYFYLVEVIKGWSEPVPVTEENLKKIPYSLLKQLWLKIQQMHGLGGEGALEV